MHSSKFHSQIVIATRFRSLLEIPEIAPGDFLRIQLGGTHTLDVNIGETCLVLTLTPRS